MRNLNVQELALVNGGENHNVMVIDPVAAVQTAIFLMSVTDQDSFTYGSVITGMGLGLVGGGIGAYYALGGACTLAACSAAVLGSAGGAAIGGLAGKSAAYVLTGTYNMIMG